MIAYGSNFMLIAVVEEIERLLGTYPQQHVSSGQAVRAMILNGMGFFSAPLYLFGEFFASKATEHLIASTRPLFLIFGGLRCAWVAPQATVDEPRS